MRPRMVSAVSILVAGLLIGAVIGIQRLSFSKQPADFSGNSFPVKSAEPYEPKEGPRGIRVTTEVQTAELKIDESKSFELDVTLDPRLAEKFVVADSAVSTGKENSPAHLQPFHNQSPPKGVQSRLLFPPSKHAKFNLEIYLAPRNGKTDPAVGLEYLSNPTDLNRNVQVRLVTE